MLSTIFSGVARCYFFLARFALGPRLIARIRHRDGLKWGVPAMLLAVPYFCVSNFLVELIKQGGNAWLSLPLLWCLVMGIAFLGLGPISLIVLVTARTCEILHTSNLHGRLGRSCCR